MTYQNVGGAAWLRGCFIAAAFVLGSQGNAFAQAEISGNRIDYLGVAANGTILAPSGRSMRYSETGAAPYTCDAFRPGTIIEEFAIEQGPWEARNSVSLTEIGTTVPTAVSADGREITWTGRAVNGPRAVTVAQSLRYEENDPWVVVNVTLTNTGTAPLTNLYYSRMSDPDHGRCNIGTEFETQNNVLRNPPLADSALVVAAASSSTGPNYRLSIGSFDTRSRVHSDGSVNTAPSVIWSRAADPDGAFRDWPIAIAFRIDSLPVGASTTLSYAFIWGVSDEVVLDRLEELRCTLLGDGAACSIGGEDGTCRANACCTGCWDGSACNPGSDVSLCGRGGEFCNDCVDGNECTVDVCSEARTCGNPAESTGTPCDDGVFCTENDVCNGAGACGGAPRDCSDGLSCTTDVCDEGANRCESSLAAGNCLIDGTCFADDQPRPSNDCEICDSEQTTSDWSFAPNAQACSDGLFCTVNDRCDGVGGCEGEMRDCSDVADCTADSCNEAIDRCEHRVTAESDRCAIDGMCIPRGELNPANPCEACNPDVSGSSWSPVSAGTECSDGVFCTADDACDGAGVCRGTPRDCGDGVSCTVDVCDEGAGRCENSLSDDACQIDGMCVAAGARNPLNPCELCDPILSQSAWSPVPAGASCSDGSFCNVQTCDGAGACEAAPRDCDDERGCTTDTCDEASRRCEHSVDVGRCLIDDVCFVDGDVNPENSCEACGSSSLTNWSGVAAGTECDDGRFCTATDACDGSGACVGSGVADCDDGISCTVDRCDPETDACIGDVDPAFCAIDGMCVPAGMENPEDACGVCEPASNPRGYTYSAEDPACDTDRDCVPDGVERSGDSEQDTDGDGDPDWMDPDDDGDGIPTRTERGEDCSDIDTDDDGTLDYLDDDDDDDCQRTLDERPDEMDRDTDDDMIPDHLDDDDDNDTLDTCLEIEDGEMFGNDVDGDGDPNWLDTESDGDDSLDSVELRGDSDGDGIPNYLDPDDDPIDDAGVDGGDDAGTDGGMDDAGPDAGDDAGTDGGTDDGGTDDSGVDAGGDNLGLAGGACNCEVPGGSNSPAPGLALLVLGFLVAIRRRR